MAPPLLTLQNISLTLGGKPLLESADLSVSPFERLCLVGRNGSGKSTLLKIAAGELEADGGRRFFQPDARVHYLPQEPDLAGFDSVRAYVEAGLGPSDDAYRVDYLLQELGLSGEEAPSTLSGGEARRAALARVLAPEPDILLLDEPTNHLDLPAIEWLEKELGTMRSALVLISHDRRFLQNLTKTTLWLDRGKTRRLEEGFAGFEAWRDKVLEEEERERHKLDRKIAMEEDWVRYGVTARRKRNQGRMARLQDLRTERREARRATGEVKMEAAQGRVSGKLVAEVVNLNKAYEGRPIVSDFSLRVQRGDRIGLVGPNGAGKTTLLRLMMGDLEPDSGSTRLGASIELASLDQKRAALDPETSLKDTLTGGGGDWVEINGERKHVVGYMKDFLFAPEQARTPVSKLSGGERGRLTLARAFSLPSNVLILDEPTNDLDLETLDLLQELLSDYPGTILLVSHDRDFLDRVATSLIVSEGKGRWQEYAGGYTDMLAQRGAGIGAKDALVTAPRSKKSATESAPPAKPVAGKTKLSFNQKFRLDQLPSQMEQLQKHKAQLQAQLNDPEFYTKNPQKFDKAIQEFTKADAALSKAEEEWLELTMLQEG